MPRAARTRARPRFYPTEDTPAKAKSTFKAGTAKLRDSITAGTVLILLSGRFRGKRVVFLKQLDSGLCCVTGPFKVNGVPLRRVNQAFCIATSTKVDVSKVKTDKFTDAYFKKPESAKKQKSEGEFFATQPEKEPLSADKIADQKTIDEALLKSIKAVPDLEHYLAARFTLTGGAAPHRMKF